MFTDIDENLPAEDINAINYVSAAGIMCGYTDGSFRPDDLVSYSALCRSLFNAFNPASYNPSKKTLNQPLHLLYSDFVYSRIQKNYSPKTNIASSTAIRIISKFYQLLFIENSTTNQHLSHFSNDSHSGKLTRITLARIFYYYTKQFIHSLTNPPVKPEELFRLWESTQNHININPFEFALQSVECAPELYPQKADLSFISRFPYLKALPISNVRKTHGIMCHIDETISCKFSPKSHSSLYQYTSLASLYTMLTQSNRASFGLPPEITLHMSNVAYLNDPDEGHFYQSKLIDLLPKQFSYEGSNIHTDDTYIVCFAEKGDELLPMWVQYANQAQGCRIEFNGSDIKVTELQYVKDTELPEVMNKLIEIIKDSSSNTALKTYATDKLHEIQYYYKSANYQHENEVRYTTTMPVKQALVDEGSSDNGTKIPRLYCNIPIPLKIKSVTLGPKCPDSERIALYLKHCGIENVYRSKIHFR